MKMLKRIRKSMLVLLGLMFVLASEARASTIYDVHLNGLNIDLVGFIETDAVGTYSPTDFDAVLLDYSLMVSGNGSFPFTFRRDNSFWGGIYGANVMVNVNGSTIELAAPIGNQFIVENLFLIANDVHNGAIENLRIFQDQLGFRPPNPPDGLILEQISTPFVLASVQPVPEPGALLLLGSGMMALLLVRREYVRKTIGHIRAVSEMKQ